MVGSATFFLCFQTPSCSTSLAQVLLAAIYRGHTLQLREPDEPWQEFPLARPKHSMPARFVAVADTQ
jgi:hypothetical protein